MMPEVKFSNNAHTIPLALGNRIFFSNYECDECNHYFGEFIESHLKQWVGFLTAFSCVRGRSGVSELKYTNGVIRYDEKIGQLVIMCRSKKQDDSTSLNPDIFNNEIDLGEGERYIPIKVYKALVKIALGFIPKDKIFLFEKTINWLKDDNYYGTLPKVAYCLYPQGNNPQPEVVLFLRKGDSAIGYPSAVVSVIMCGIRLLYIIPFASNDDFDYALDENYKKYWEIFKLYSKSPNEWNHENLASNNWVQPHLTLNLKQSEEYSFGSAVEQKSTI